MTDPEVHLRIFMRLLGHSLTGDGRRETPARVARFYRDFLSPPTNSWTSFQNVKNYDQIVAVSTPFYSLCEHHLLPFFGTAYVGYIPRKRLVGLSKLARAVEERARRLTTQESITEEVADLLGEKLSPLGVMVVLKARHLCMEMRGVNKPGAETTTSAIRGAFKRNPTAKEEFVRLVGLK